MLTTTVSFLQPFLVLRFLKIFVGCLKNKCKKNEKKNEKRKKKGGNKQSLDIWLTNWCHLMVGHSCNFGDTIGNIFGMERGYDTIRQTLHCQ